MSLPTQHSTSKSKGGLSITQLQLKDGGVDSEQRTSDSRIFHKMRRKGKVASKYPVGRDKITTACLTIG